ncbi:MAG: hypothetical protein V2A73_19755 [Pseudomonadota bacterium]
MEKSEARPAQHGDGAQDEKGFEPLEDVRAMTERTMARVESLIREHPAKALLVALSAGYLLGRIVRR